LIIDTRDKIKKSEEESILPPVPAKLTSL